MTRQKTSPEEIYLKAKKLGIKFNKSQLDGMVSKCKATCLECGFNRYSDESYWMPKPDYIINGKRGCPECDRLRVVARMIGNNIGKKYSCNDNYFNKLTHEKTWLLGLLAADGNVGDSNVIGLSQSGDIGLKLLSYVKEILNFSGKVEKKSKRKNRQTKYAQLEYVLRISSSKFVKSLEKYNIVPRKSLIYKYPDILPIQYLYSFVRGLIDGDGCVYIHKNKNTGNINLGINIVGTGDLLYKLKELISIKSNIKRIKDKYGNDSKNTYVITWNSLNAIKLGKIIFGNKKLYKSIKFKKFWKYLKEINKPTIHEKKLLKKKIKILKLLQKGYSVKNISKMTNTKEDTIYKYRKEHKLGINTGVGSRRFK